MSELGKYDMTAGSIECVAKLKNERFSSAVTVVFIQPPCSAARVHARSRDSKTKRSGKAVKGTFEGDNVQPRNLNQTGGKW